MRCEKFEARLQELLDQRQRPECDALLLEHAEACENCREMLMLEEQLFAGLEMWEAPATSEGFAARVVSRCAAETRVVQVAAQRAAPSSLPWKLVAGALAASLLVALLSIAARTNGPDDAPQRESIAEHPAPTAPPSAPPPSDLPKTDIAQQPSALPQPGAPLPPEMQQGTLPEHLAVQWVENAPELLDGRATGRMIREVTSTLPDVPGVEESIPGLRPITSSFSTTISMVRRTLPGGRDQADRQEDQKPEPPAKPQADVSRDDRHDATA